jgi:hypothetical protein
MSLSHVICGFILGMVATLIAGAFWLFSNPEACRMVYLINGGGV